MVKNATQSNRYCVHEQHKGCTCCDGLELLMGGESHKPCTPLMPALLLLLRVLEPVQFIAELRPFLLFPLPALPAVLTAGT